jgi:hypothetical protein
VEGGGSPRGGASGAVGDDKGYLFVDRDRVVLAEEDDVGRPEVGMRAVVFGFEVDCGTAYEGFEGAAGIGEATAAGVRAPPKEAERARSFLKKPPSFFFVSGCCGGTDDGGSRITGERREKVEEELGSGD